MAKKVIIFIVAYFFYLPLVLGGIAIAVLVADRYVDTAENPVPAFVMLILLTLLIAAPILWFCITWNRPSKSDRKLQASGRRAMARILEVQDTGVSSGGGLTIYVRLILEVHPDGDEPFKAKLETANSRVSIMRPGETLFVRYDPSKPSHVVLDEAGDTPGAYPPGSSTPFGTPTIFESAESMAGEPPRLADTLNSVLRQMSSGRLHSGVYVMGPDGKPLPQQTEAVAQEPDLVEQLKDLDDLHRKSALTDAEYEAAKRKLLA